MSHAAHWPHPTRARIQDSRLRPVLRRSFDGGNPGSFAILQRVRIRLIGYWRSEAEPHWPDPRDLVDEGWEAGERDRVASYLSTGICPWVQAGISTCRLCDRPNGSAELTDGVYLWPEGLAHYVRRHSVRLPAEVVEHIAARVDRVEELDVERWRWRLRFVDQDWWGSVHQSG